jgi:hypothetical protein
VQPQTVQGRVSIPPRAAPAERESAREAPDASEALVELTSLNRTDPEDIVREPPEIPTPVAQIIRRLSDSAAAGGDV